MANVIITLQIMPESPDVNTEVIKQHALPLIERFGGDVGKEEVVPVAFGLKALKLYFVMDESKGSTEALELDIAALPGVKGVEVVDVRRALG